MQVNAHERQPTVPRSVPTTVEPVSFSVVCGFLSSFCFVFLFVHILFCLWLCFACSAFWTRTGTEPADLALQIRDKFNRQYDSLSVSPLSFTVSLSHSLFIWLFSLVTTNCVNCCSPHLHLLHICPHQISRNRSYHNQIFLNIPYQENEKRFGCHVIAAARGDQQGAEYEAHRLSVSLSSQSLLKLPPSHCLFVFVIFYCRKASKPGLVPLYIFECAAKLKMKPLTAACAAIVFHRFFKEVKASDYDEFVSSRRGSNRTGLRFLT